MIELIKKDLRTVTSVKVVYRLLDPDGRPVSVHGRYEAARLALDDRSDFPDWTIDSKLVVEYSDNTMDTVGLGFTLRMHNGAGDQIDSVKVPNGGDLRLQTYLEQ